MLSLMFFVLLLLENNYCIVLCEELFFRLNLQHWNWLWSVLHCRCTAPVTHCIMVFPWRSLPILAEPNPKKYRFCTSNFKHIFVTNSFLGLTEETHSVYSFSRTVELGCIHIMNMGIRQINQIKRGCGYIMILKVNCRPLEQIYLQNWKQ